MVKEEKIIIGIDPGSIVMGYGILQVLGKECRMVAMGVLKMHRDTSPYERLRRIYEGVEALIRRYEPSILAIEAPFYGKNVQSMLKLGRAQGVAIAAALARSIVVEEYAPMIVKRAVTGNGAATKEQVAEMLQRLLRIPDDSMQIEADATDGLAVAYCHYLQMMSPLPRSSGGGWKEFIRKNPDKVHGPK